MIGQLKAQLAGALIALDFDGTLSPIVPDPMRARPVPGVLETLARLAGLGASIAVVTGRDVRTVLELGDLRQIPGLRVSGLHGAESWRDGRLRTRDEPAGLAELRGVLPPLLPPGVWLEDKRLSLVVHTRRAEQPERALAELNQFVPRLAAEHGLQAHPGKQVIEIRIPDLSKATALESLLAEQPTATLFAGDDLGDLPAVRAVRHWAERTGRPALTVAVGAVAELAAATDIALAGPAELAGLLAELAA
ncbi:MAG: trehalose-phosphatase [Jatrophihabitantaceae bacterium]